MSVVFDKKKMSQRNQRQFDSNFFLKPLYRTTLQTLKIFNHVYATVARGRATGTGASRCDKPRSHQ